jgi:D-sedoheptulose 7-phosphate isomerase
MNILKNNEMKTYSNDFNQILNESSLIRKKISEDKILIENINKTIGLITSAFAGGNKVLFCGNGGSAADAQHLAAEFSGRFYKDRDPLPSEALHCNASYLTAVANDYGYEFIYSRLLKGIGSSGDILIGISTSGNSKNIINAFEVAKQKNITTIALTGSNGGKMKLNADILLNIPSDDTPRIQEMHILIGHFICEMVEKNLF